MDLKLWAIYGLMTILMVVAEATRLFPCDSSRNRDVVENTIVTFYCDQYSVPVEWSYKAPGSANNYVPFSTCNATACTQSGIGFTFRYISANNSSLDSIQTYRNLSFAGGTYKCDDKECTVHITVPASLSNATGFITRTDQSYYLHCSIDITKVYSSRGQYSCFWQNGRTKVNGTLKLQPPPHDTNNTSDRMGTCKVTLQLSNPSDAMCNVTVSPGNTFASSGIVRPSHPEISCPTCPVPENSTVTCTCSTDNFGQPAGRLVWYTGTNGVFDREIVRGNFEVNRLTMTWTVTRSDHNVTMFRCVNEWLENINSLTDFTAIVKGDAPSSSERRHICDEANTPGEDAQSVIIIGLSIGWGATVVCFVVIFVVIKRQRKAKERPRAQSFKPSVQHNVVRSDVSIIAGTAGESRDNPSFGAYESLQSADVGQTSVYSEMTHGSGPVYGNSATPKK